MDGGSGYWGIPVYDDREEPDTKEADMAEHELRRAAVSGL